MGVKSSVRKIVSRASKMEEWPHICPKKLGCNTLCTFYIWFEHKHIILYVYMEIYNISMYTEQDKLLPCRSWPIYVSQVHAHTDFSRVDMQFQRRAHRATRMLWLPWLPATFFPFTPASQMASSQETACLRMLDGTQKSPRAIISYWHLGQALSFPRGYSVNPVWKKAWRHSSKHSLDISKVLHGQMESLCLSICRPKA